MSPPAQLESRSKIDVVRYWENGWHVVESMTPKNAEPWYQSSAGVMTEGLVVLLEINPPSTWKPPMVPQMALGGGVGARICVVPSWARAGIADTISTRNSVHA